MNVLCICWTDTIKCTKCTVHSVSRLWCSFVSGHLTVILVAFTVALLSIFSLFRMLQFKWQYNYVTSNSCLKYLICVNSQILIMSEFVNNKMKYGAGCSLKTENFPWDWYFVLRNRTKPQAQDQRTDKMFIILHEKPSPTSETLRGCQWKSSSLSLPGWAS